MPRPMSILLPLAVVLSATALASQLPRILDINKTERILGGLVEWTVVEMGGWLYYAGSSPSSGVELYRCQPGANPTPQLVRDIRPGAASSHPFRMRVVSGTLLFFADDGINGTELWRSDGTAAGTVLVRDIQPGPSGSFSRNIFGSAERSVAVLGNILLFTANDGANGFEPWRSDGTTAGTVLLRDINPGAAWSSTAQFVTSGGLAFFDATDPAAGKELWRTDGTAAGTVRIADIEPGPVGSNPFSLTAIGSTLWFQAYTAATGVELWKSDGTTAGTVEVRDIGPGGRSSSYPSDFRGIGNDVVFNADSSVGRELWRSDGTAAGTVLVRDIRPGTFPTMEAFPTLGVLGNVVLFAADDGTNGNELWRTDGTTAGTVLLKDINPGSGAGIGQVRGISASTSTHVWFAADDGSSGVELWRTDGTSSGTVRVADVWPGATASRPRSLLALAGTSGGIAFVADDATLGPAVWMSLGTAASTRLLAASFNSVGWSSDDSNPVGLDDLAGKLLFTANDGAAGYEPWVSDGSPSGTRLLADLRTGAADSIWNGDSSAPSTSEMPKAIAWDAAFFMAWDNSGGPSLWVSDGTAAGTARIRQFENILYGWRFEGVGVGDHVYFLGRDAGRFGLWVTYGSAATTTLLYPNIWPVSFSALGNTAFFFNATSSYQASGLWRTNGQQVASVIPALQVNTIDIHVEREGRSLYLLTLDAAYNAILRRLTETGPPTTVKSFRAAPPSSGHARRLLANVGGTLFFPAAGAAGGVDLWRSDGTAANTTIVTNFGAAGSMDELTEVGSDLYFTIATPNLDFELWKTDGTAAGTVRLLRLLGGTPNRPLIGSVIAVGTRRACFSAVTGGLFPGLWITDGTVAGTQPILTETWRYYGAEPAALSNGHLFALVNDKVYGKELASVAFTGVAHHSGTGCSGSGYPPELSATDPVLGANSTIAVRNAIPNSAGMLLIGAPSSPQRLSHGCSLHIGLAGAFPVPFRTDAAGRWVQPGVAVPNLPALIGARVTLQAGVGPASTPPLGLDLSGGVLMVVGR